MNLARETLSTDHNEQLGTDLHSANALQIEEIAQRIGVPLDRPRFSAVLETMASAVAELNSHIGGAAQAASVLLSLRPAACATSARGASLNVMSKRRGRHLLYTLLVELSSFQEARNRIDERAFRTLGAWLLRAVVSGWSPDPESVAKLRAVLVRPESATARHWGGAWTDPLSRPRASFVA